MDASKFVFIVYSCQKNLDPYAFAVYDLMHGMFPEMPIYILYGDPKLDAPYKTLTLGDSRHYLVVHVKDTYESLNIKTMAMIKAVHGLHHDYIGMFKCDDDVLVNTEQLMRLMFTLHKEPHHYVGVRIRNDKEKVGDQKYREQVRTTLRRVHQQETVVPVCEYAAGPIYYLSRTAVTHLATNSNKLIWKLYEDLMVGLNLQAAGFRLSPMSIYTEHIMMKNTVSYHDKNRFTSKILFPYLQGGLANQVFQIFATMTVASALGFLPVLHTHVNKNAAAHGATFQVMRQILPQLKIVDTPARVEPYHNFVYYEAANDCFRDKRSHIIDVIGPHISTASLHGYFIAANYVRDEYAAMLHLKPTNPSLIHLPWQNTFFIHIRLGDYKTISMYQIPLTLYYEHCIQRVIATYHSAENPVKFYICTNEHSPFFTKIISALPQVPGVKYTIQAATDNAVDTLYIMRSCQGGICTNSTLSWLGAFLLKPEYRNKQRVFMPAPWVRVPNPLKLQASDMQDVYPSWATVYNTSTNQFADSKLFIC
jgi:hypothetical protein